LAYFRVNIGLSRTVQSKNHTPKLATALETSSALPNHQRCHRWHSPLF